VRSHAFMPIAASLAVFFPAALIAQSAAPAPRAVPLTETVHGITLGDEYRWMEDPASKAEWGSWVAAESRRTDAMLGALPQRAGFAETIAQVSSSLTRQSGYRRAGPTEIWLKAEPGDPVARLMVRDGKGTRVLVDPGKVDGDKLASMGAITLSPDGRTVAVHLSSGGSEVGSTRFFDIASGKETGQPVPGMWGEFSIAFLPGGMIAYTQLAPEPVGGDPLKGMTAWLRPLAGGTPVKVLGGQTGGADVPDSDFPILLDAAHSPFVAGISAGARVDNVMYVSPRAALLAGKPEWQMVVSMADKIGGGAVRGNMAYLLSAKTNPAREVLVRPLDAKGRPGPATVLFKGNERLILTGIAAARDGIYITATTDGAARLFFTPGGRVAVREVKLPFEGSIFGLDAQPDGNGISFALTGWTSNMTSLTARGGVVRATGIASESWSGANGVAVQRHEAVSADGTRVPLVVLRGKGASGPVPTIVEAYGGYGMDTAAPYYDRNGMAWLAKGGAMAFCGVRGGGERGRSWHEGGRGPNKPRGMEDLIACAETLTAKGIAPARGPVATGASMAGTLVPTAVLRKPAAFGGMITRVGVVNPVRIAQAENGANQFAEIGDPANPKQFADLVAMDAYQMIPGAKGLPPSLMVIGMNDRRVAPWMTAKFVARAQAKWPGTVWLRGDDKAGHGVGTTEEVRRSEWADIFAFAWWAQTK
jgi:prolyl oligopeptidase